MIFHRTLSQGSRSTPDAFPLEGSLTPPVAALDREAAYQAYCAQQNALVCGTRRFDVESYPSIFELRGVKALSQFLQKLPNEQLLLKIPYLAEWCSQVYDGKGLLVP